MRQNEWVILKEHQKIKVRSPWRFFKILPMSAVICIKKVLHGYEVAQYLQK